MPSSSNHSYQSILSSGLKTIHHAEKKVSEVTPGPISSSRMVQIIESERMSEIGAQVIREADQVVGMLLNVRK